MASFSLEWRSSTKKDLRKLPPQEIARILAEVELLAAEPFPHGSEKLAGSEHTYRIRIGDYRAVYEVLAQSKKVVVQRVRHRKDVYRH
jgi:mRNA interferase RelE/StbE